MKNKTISITDELYESLSKEENASGLICKLLDDYYNKIMIIKGTNTTERLKEKKEEIEKNMSEKLKEIELLESNIKKEEMEREQREKDELTEMEQNRLRREQELELKKEEVKKRSFLYEMGREMTDVEYDTFIAEQNLGQVKNIWEFIKKLKDKL